VIRRETVDELPKVVASLEDFARRHPRSIVALEGLNEIKIWPANYRGDTSFAGATAVQCELYRLARKPDSPLRELPVIALTLGGASQRDHDRLGDLSDCADFGNAHVYFDTRPPGSSWRFARELARRATARNSLEGWCNSPTAAPRPSRPSARNRPIASCPNPHPGTIPGTRAKPGRRRPAADFLRRSPATGPPQLKASVPAVAY